MYCTVFIKFRARPGLAVSHSAPTPLPAWGVVARLQIKFQKNMGGPAQLRSALLAMDASKLTATIVLQVGSGEGRLGGAEGGWA